MIKAKTKELKEVEFRISDNEFCYRPSGDICCDDICLFLEEKRGVILPNEKILCPISTKEGYEENIGRRIHFNLEGKKLQLTDYMCINENNELVPMVREGIRDIVNDWHVFRRKHPEKAVNVTRYGIEDAAVGWPLVLHINKELGLRIGWSCYDAQVLYQKQGQAYFLGMRRDWQITLPKFDRDALLKTRGKD